MKICTYGLWHLGSVTAACLAKAGFETVGVDDDTSTVRNLSQGISPLHEPGLEDLLKAQLASGQLSFTTEAAAAVADADILWVTFDTSVDDEDRADINFVKGRVESIFPFLKDGAIVLISSQLPVGTTTELEARFCKNAGGRMVSFAYSPENLRLGQAIDAFNKPARIVIGVRDERVRRALTPVLQRFSENLLWVRVESAEMLKHALNAFLATQVTFINEVASVCVQVGADAVEVERGLRSDARVGSKAYVSPGAGFAGGTLAREVMFLKEIARAKGLVLPLLDGVLVSNREHLRWPMQQLAERLIGKLTDTTVAVFGLAYKPVTDTLHRSQAVELCRWLSDRKVHIKAFDPFVRKLPADLAVKVFLTDSMDQALEGADALVITTKSAEFAKLSVDTVVSRMRNQLVLDQNRSLCEAFVVDPRVRYLAVGKPL